ncbi:E3 ubiquitin-protein ligase RNF25-like isoform X2 [Dysidea avara]|uniref:E3 ubiquitin-protein ligase RNF25-like isoform X2 n=1 Tax=Dysidea avara TaxID=196820 RepID=UPI003318F72D
MNRRWQHELPAEVYNIFVVTNELELLTNIYCDELVVKEYDGLITLSVHITPRTDDDRQFVYADVMLELNKQYPQSPPVTKIVIYRGLSDAHITSIRNDLQIMAQDRLGCPMVYDLLEHVRDCLTDQNRPCGICSICMCVFEEQDDFTKTDCYHYFHVYCFSHYVQHQEQLWLEEVNDDSIPGQPVAASPKCVKCPVCRVELSGSSSCFRDISGVVVCDSVDEQTVSYLPSDDDKQRMEQWRRLMDKQRTQGGIIDHSKDPHIVDWNWVSWTPPSTQQADVTLATGTTISTTTTTTVTNTTSVTSKKTSSHQHRTSTGNYYYVNKKARHKQYYH